MRRTLNGAAAHKVTPGDLVIICSYAEYTEEEVERHQPRLVYVDAQNSILSTSAAVA